MKSQCERLFLIGYRGTGKSTVAEMLARRLGWSWVDVDGYIEEEQAATIADIFARIGEAGFRELEGTALRALCAREKVVIATGGGVILREANRKLLRQAGYVIWLTADAVTLAQRLQRDPTTLQRRPALTAQGGHEEIVQLLQEREPLYRECADLTVNTARRTAEEVTDQIHEWWNRDR